MRLAGALLCSAVAGVAVWLSLGAMAVSSVASPSARVGLLAHPAWIAIPFLWTFSSLRRLQRRDTRHWPVALAPLLLALPWLPGPLPPTVFVWLGPVVGLAGVVFAMLPGGRDLITLGLVREWRLPGPRLAPVLACAVSAIIYAAGWRQLADRVPGGDEPHYLVITQSLLLDGDLRIENNHARHDYQSYFPGTLRPDYLARGRDREIYSVHAPGLSVLVLPAFALGGYHAVVGFLVALAAIGTALLWTLAYRVTGSHEAAWFGWASVTLSAPYALHAFTVYPDLPAAVVVMIALVALASAETLSFGGAVGVGAVLSTLPWLHTRYAVLAGVLGLAVALRLWHRTDRLRALVAFGAVPAIGAAAWFAFFWSIYGTPDPSAPYGGWRHAQSSIDNVGTGLGGLLFDQQFGLIPTAPVLVTGLLGFGVMSRQMPAQAGAGPSGAAGVRRLGLEIAITCAVYAATASSYGMWWGGHSAPARFLVPLVLALGLPAACCWRWCRSQATRQAALVALGVTLFVTAAFFFVDRGRLVYNERDGVALWLRWVSPYADLSDGLPSFHRFRTAIALEHVAIWLLALVAAWLVVAEVDRRRPGQTGLLSLVTLVAFAMAAMGAVAMVWRSAGASGITASTSQTWLLATEYAGHHPLAVTYDGYGVRSAAPAQTLSALTIASSAGWDGRAPAPPLVTDLPPGRYRLNLSLNGSPRGAVQIVIGRGSVPIREIGLEPNSAPALAVRLDLPAGASSLTVRPDEAAGAVLSSVTLTPLSVDRRTPDGRSWLAASGARYGRVAAYFPNNQAFVEATGFWTQPNVPTEMVLQADAAGTPLVLGLKNGPIRNHLVINVGTWETQIDLEPGGENAVELPFGRDDRPVVVRLTASGGFRPADVDPESNDRRRLSCWVEPR